MRRDSRRTCPSGTPSSVAPSTAASVISSGRRQARQDQVEHRHVVDEGAAEVAADQSAEEDAVLLPQRQVETVGADRLLADLLRHVGRDHHVDRVADRVDADEHQRRDDQHHDRCLQQALDDESEHRQRRQRELNVGCGGGRGARSRSATQAQPSAMIARVSSTATSHIASTSSSLRWYRPPKLPSPISFFFAARVDALVFREVDHRLCARTASARRPAASRGSSPSTTRARPARIDLLDLGHGLRRIPPVVPLDLHAAIAVQPFEHGAVRRAVAAMAVDDDDLPEAGAHHVVEDVAHQRAQRRQAQRHRAGVVDETRREPVVDGRVDRHLDRFCGLDRDPLGQDHVDAQAQVGVLFGRADRQHRALVVLDVLLHLHPVHVADSHRLSRTVGSTGVRAPARAPAALRNRSRITSNWNDWCAI